MAVAVRDVVTEVDLVVEAALRIYASRRESAVDTALAELLEDAGPVGAWRAVVAGASRTVEVVLDEGTDPAELATAVWRLAGRGLRVVVLVGAAEIGEAHRALRGTPCLLQPWWVAEDTVRFGRHEIP